MEDLEGLVDAIRYIGSRTSFSGVAFNVNHSVSSVDEVAVNPYFRKSLFNIFLGTAVDYGNWTANKVAQDEITHAFLPTLEAITPDDEVYLNEADFQAPSFQRVFYGDHYERLLRIKWQYDPEDLFYAKTAVGSERLEERLDGRLCRVAAAANAS